MKAYTITPYGIRTSRAISMLVTLAVSGWLIAALLLTAVAYRDVRAVACEREVARYEQEQKVNAGRTLEQKLKYTQYRRDL